MPSQESEPFLPFSKEDAKHQGPHDESQSTQSKWLRYKGIIFHCILIAAYTCVSIIAIRSSSCRALYPNSESAFSPCCPHVFVPPTNDPGPLKDLDIRYKPRTFVNLSDHNIYAGPPSPRLDTAWDALLGDMNLRVSAAELAQDGQDSVALPEGGGHLAWLGAIHELHCIVSVSRLWCMRDSVWFLLTITPIEQKMLREWKYRDHYHPNITSVEYEHWDSHAGTMPL